MKKPLNEPYGNEILEAYQKISDTFDDFTQLIRSRVPYEEWPEHCKIAGLNEELIGPAGIGCATPGELIQVKFKPPPKQIPIAESLPDFADLSAKNSDDIVKDLEDCIKQGWRHVQSDCRPDESFRAMIQIMIRWMAYMEAQKNYNKHSSKIWEHDH